MKKILLLLFAFLATNTQCMEPPDSADNNDEEARMFEEEARIFDEWIARKLEIALAHNQTDNVYKLLAMEEEGFQAYSHLSSSAKEKITEEDSFDFFIGEMFQVIQNDEIDQLICFLDSVDVNVSDKSGNTFLIAAADAHRKEMVKLLIAKGANVNAVNNYGNTALRKASRNGNSEIVELLLDAEADPNVVTRDGNTVLMNASFLGYKDVVKLLLDKGAHVNAANKSGKTALMYASKAGHEDVVALLLEYGANVHLFNISGKTALKLAEEEKRKDIIPILKKAMALASNDIVKPSRWIDNTAVELPTNHLIFNEDFRHKREFHYNTPDIKNNRPIIWIVIHGTWGTENTSFFDDDNVKDQNFRHIMRAAAWYAHRKHQPLKLYSFTWRGECTHEDRQRAAHILVLFLQKIKNAGAEVVLLSHSHGGNVANIVSNLIGYERPIHLIIHLACPIRTEEKPYNPKYYKHLLYFWSKADIVARLARINEQKKTKLSEINKYFFGDNDFAALDGKITVGLQTKINGGKTGHSEIIDIVEFLPEIIEKLHDDFPYHYSRSGKFFLNVASKDSNHPIHLVCNPLELHDAVEEFDYLGNHDQPGSIDETNLESELARARSEKKHYRNTYLSEIYQ